MMNALQFARHNRVIYPIARELRDQVLYVRDRYRGTFAQHGEDIWVRDYFGGKRGGFYVDIGASHPYNLSNTALLYFRYAWRGITVEPLPDLARLHRRWRPDDDLRQVAIGPTPGRLTFHEMYPGGLSTLDDATAKATIANGTAELVRDHVVNAITLDQLLSPIAERVDLLSIDLEGMDAAVVQSYDFRGVRPELICVEFNDLDARALTLEHLQACGYRFAAELGCNLIVERAR
jgi:FkbM family methyltransferase